MGIVNKQYTFQDKDDADPTQVNTNFDDLYNELNGNIDEKNIDFSKETLISTIIDEIKLDVKEMIYPVGSLYFNANDGTNPSTLLGFGNWEKFGKGKVPVGHDPDDTDFYTAEETGGAKTHTLTEAEIPSHSHDSGSLSNNSTGAHTHTFSGTSSSAGSHGHTGSTNTTGNHGEHVHTGGKYTYEHRFSDGGGGDDRSSFTDEVSRGSHSHSLSIAGAGSHTHYVSGTTSSQASHSHTISGDTSSIGGGNSHENRPPFYALAYLMKL
jgi:microcystin-dependent protein